MGIPGDFAAFPSVDMRGIKVERTDPLTDEGWDRKVGDLPEAGFFHGAAWARVLHGTYGFKPEYLTVKTAGGLRAVLPLMEVDSWLTGRRGVSLPFTDACAPVGLDLESVHRLYQAAIDHATARRWRYLEVRGGRSLFKNAVSSTSFWGHRLDLRGDETALFARIESSVRRAVRKAEKSEVTVEFSNDIEPLHAFYGLLCLTRKRHGVPPQPWRFFKNIHRHVLATGRGWVVLARHRGVPVAGAVFMHSGSTAIYKFGASDETRQPLRANNLVMWHAIKRYAREGFTVLDFGRTSMGNDGLRRFKLGWGTTEHPIEYVRYDLKYGRFVTVRDEAAGWHNHVFRHMPSFLSRAAGELLYRHIA